MRKPLIICMAATVCVTLSCSQKPTSSNSEAAPTASTAVDYSPRIGIGVRTGGRTCLAIQNGAVAPNSPVTLINTTTPQTFVEGQISAQSNEACPITETVPPGIVSYDVSLPEAANLPKMTPLIGVLGSALSNEIAQASNGVVADLDHRKARNTFRACGAADGVYLTVWRNDPLTGTLVWAGHYFESGNPGTLPACTAAEQAPPPIKNR